MIEKTEQLFIYDILFVFILFLLFFLFFILMDLSLFTMIKRFIKWFHEKLNEPTKIH